jgi:HEAT repeat protein
VDDLLKDARSGDRNKALAAFSYAVSCNPTPKDLAPVFREAIRSPDAEIRCLAAVALWDIEPAEKEAMIAVLKTEFPQNGRYASRSLTRLGVAAKALLPEVLAQFKLSEQPYDWEHYFFPTVARFGPEVASDLLPFLADSYRGTYLHQAILPLGPQAVPRFQPALVDKDPLVRQRALEILKYFGPANRRLRREILKCLDDSNDAVRSAALEVVAEMGDEILAAADDYLPRLRAYVADGKTAFHIRCRAADVLGELGPPAKEALAELGVALDAPPMLRLRAALAIRQIQPGNKEAEAVILDLLNSEHTPVEEPWDFLLRGLIASGAAVPAPAPPAPRRDPTQVYVSSLIPELSMTTLPAERVVPALFARWQKTADETQRWNLGHGIMVYYGHAPAALPILYRWCDAREPQVRRMAVTELCKHEEAVAEVCPVLAEELRGTELERWRPIWSDLRQLGPLAKPLLPQLLKLWGEADDDERRVLVAEILLQIEGPHRELVWAWMRREFKAQTSKSYSEIFRLLERFEPDHTDLLQYVRERIQAEHPWTSVGWFDTLGRIGPAAKAALPEVRAALETPHTLRRVQAARALWKIEGRPDDVVPILIAALKEEANSETSGWYRPPNRDFARPAVETLAEIGPPARAALPVIRRQMDYGDVALRAAARKALRFIER